MSDVWKTARIQVSCQCFRPDVLPSHETCSSSRPCLQVCLEHRRLELIPNTPSKLTKEVLRGLGTIESRFLFHAHTTITQRGGFSYKDRSTDDQIDALVDTNGSVAGMFRYRVLQEADVEQIVPLGSHKMVEYNISERSILPDPEPKPSIS